MKLAPLFKINRDQLGTIIGKKPSSLKIPDNTEEVKTNEIDDQTSFKLEDLKYLKELGRGPRSGVRKMLYIPEQKIVALKTNYLSIIIEYMDKGSLANIIEKLNNVPEMFLGIIAFQCLKGLEYLHDTHNMIHKEIKPSNILVNSEGQVKLADPDLVSKENDAQNELSYYSSPEKCRGGKYSYDTDIWSLGLVIFECALGRHPYLDLLNCSVWINFFDVFEIFISTPTPELPDYFSADLRDFLSICLKKEMGARSSAKELLEHPFIKKSALANKDLFKAWLEQI